jgi:CRISPR/Cas system CSM-associated protein Csm4 (group 5 of RAMP superfamily)
MLTRHRVALLEAQIKELRRNAERVAMYGTTASSEAMYRMWQAEREDNIRLRMLLQEREREHGNFRERVESGLRLLYDRAGDLSAKLAGFRGEVRVDIKADITPYVHAVNTVDEALTETERRILDKFKEEMRKGTE